MGKLSDLIGAKILGKCPFCGKVLVKWEHEGVRVIECETPNCFQYIKKKPYFVVEKNGKKVVIPIED